MKLRLIAAGMAALGLSASVALAQTAPANPPPPPPPANKPVLSYALGFDMANRLSAQKVDIDINGMIKGMQDGFANRNPAYSADQMQVELMGFERRIMAQARADFERKAAENKAASDAFLAQNRSKPGITTLPSGIQYRVIETGTGPKPTESSEVQLHYRASLSNGAEIANTYAQGGAADPQPASFRISEFRLEGVREILVMMPAGSRWEVFLPPEKGYGNDPRSSVGPGQALVFDIKLLSVK